MRDGQAERDPERAGARAATCGNGDEVAVARHLCYHFFATTLSDPRAAGWRSIIDRKHATLVAAAAHFLAERAAGFDGQIAPGERPPAEFALDAALDPARLSVECVGKEYQRIFGFLLSKDCPPYESEYCPQTFSIYRSQRMGDVAGFYRAFGLEPAREVPERHDHIALEMEFMAWLIGKEQHALQRGDAAALERAEICREAQMKFFRDHLGWWVPAFGAALWREAEGVKCGGESGGPRTFFGCLATALAAFVAAERLSMGIEKPTELVAPRPVEDSAEMTCGGCEPQHGSSATIEESPWVAS